MISHTFVKKINLSLPIVLSQNKNLDIVCVAPKKIFQGKNIVYSDYKKKDVVGFNETKKWQGRVILIDFVENKSTTNLIERIKTRVT